MIGRPRLVTIARLLPCARCSSCSAAARRSQTIYPAGDRSGTADLQGIRVLQQPQRGSTEVRQRQARAPTQPPQAQPPLRRCPQILHRRRRLAIAPQGRQRLVRMCLHAKTALSRLGRLVLRPLAAADLHRRRGFTIAPPEPPAPCGPAPANQSKLSFKQGTHPPGRRLVHQNI